MAVAIPLLIAGTEIGAAAAATLGMTASTLALGTSIAMGVTGIGAKINKAASKVFGEDLVNIANIGGAIFMATGGFGGSASAAPSGGVSSAGGAVAAPGFDPWVISDAGGIAGAGVATGADVAGALPSYAGDATAVGYDPGAIPTAPSQGGLLKTVVDTGKSLADKGVSAWKSMDPKTQSALISAGGNVLTGMAQGKAAEAEMQARFANENRYKSGSGLTYWQKQPAPYTPPSKP